MAFTKFDAKPKATPARTGFMSMTQKYPSTPHADPSQKAQMMTNMQQRGGGGNAPGTMFDFRKFQITEGGHSNTPFDQNGKQYVSMPGENSFSMKFQSSIREKIMQREMSSRSTTQQHMVDRALLGLQGIKERLSTLNDFQLNFASGQKESAAPLSEPQVDFEGWVNLEEELQSKVDYFDQVFVHGDAAQRSLLQKVLLGAVTLTGFSMFGPAFTDMISDALNNVYQPNFGFGFDFLQNGDSTDSLRNAALLALSPAYLYLMRKIQGTDNGLQPAYNFVQPPTPRLNTWAPQRVLKMAADDKGNILKRGWDLAQKVGEAEKTSGDSKGPLLDRMNAYLERKKAREAASANEDKAKETEVKASEDTKDEDKDSSSEGEKTSSKGTMEDRAAAYLKRKEAREAAAKEEAGEESETKVEAKEDSAEGENKSSKGTMEDRAAAYLKRKAAREAAAAGEDSETKVEAKEESAEGEKKSGKGTMEDRAAAFLKRKAAREAAAAAEAGGETKVESKEESADGEKKSGKGTMEDRAAAFLKRKAAREAAAAADANSVGGEDVIAKATKMLENAKNKPLAEAALDLAKSAKELTDAAKQFTDAAKILTDAASQLTDSAGNKPAAEGDKAATTEATAAPVKKPVKKKERTQEDMDRLAAMADRREKRQKEKEEAKKEAEKNAPKVKKVNRQFAQEFVADPKRTPPPKDEYTLEHIQEFNKEKWKWNLVEQLEGQKELLIWNKSDLDERYQVMHMECDGRVFDPKKFAEFVRIPQDQVAYATPEKTDELARDFPWMKPEQIGVFNIFNDNGMLSFVDGCFYDCIGMLLDDHRDKAWVSTDLKNGEEEIIMGLDNVETASNYWEWLEEKDEDKTKIYYTPMRVIRPTLLAEKAAVKAAKEAEKQKLRDRLAKQKAEKEAKKLATVE